MPAAAGGKVDGHRLLGKQASRLYLLYITCWKKRLYIYQVGNTSSHKNTEVYQLEPWLALGWVTIKGLDIDAVAADTVKWSNGAKTTKKKRRRVMSAAGGRVKGAWKVCRL